MPTCVLRYLGFGERRYDLSPVPVTPRRRWEFQAALRGRIAPVLPRRELALQSRRMWLLPPTLAHGWTGDGQPARVLVLQPQRVPAPIEAAARQAARAGQLLTWDLADADAAWLEREIPPLLATFAAPGRLDLMRQELLVAEVSWRALAAAPLQWSAQPCDGSADGTVRRALAWMAEQVAEPFDERRLAQAVAVSPAHLRRLFHQVEGRPPRAAQLRLRLQEADRLMLASGLSLEAVAVAVGFASAAALGRAYKRERGRSPGAVRREPLAANRHPSHR